MPATLQASLQPFKFMRVILLLALSFTASAIAQEKAARTCRILFMNPPADAPRKIFLFDGVASQEVELPEMNFSDVYKIASSDTATAVTLLRAPVVDAKDIPAGAPIAKLPAAIVDFYLVVTADSNNMIIPLKLQVIDAGAEKFKRGQMMWYNLTSNSVGGQLGSQKLAMKGQSRVIIDAPAKANEAFDVNLSYLIPNDPQFHPICDTKWLHDPRARMVMFVYGGEDNSAPQVVGFKDFREAEEEKKP